MRTFRSAELAAAAVSLPMVVAMVAAACGGQRDGAEPAPRAAALEAHVRFLASDRLRGREPGTAGFGIAADYVASQFRLLGLGALGDDGGDTGAGAGESYFQTVPLRATRRDNDAAAMEVHYGESSTGEAVGPLRSLVDFVIDPEPAHPTSSVTAPVVFVGFGIDAPELGVSDYEDLDVDGRIVLMLSGAPAGLPNEEHAHLARTDTKARSAASRGAIGVLRVDPPGAGPGGAFARAVRGAEGISVSWEGRDGQGHDPAPDLRAGAVVSREVAIALFAGAERSFAEVGAELGAAGAAGVAPRGFPLPVQVTLSQSSTYTRFASPNVVALLVGSDPDLRHEHVVLTAHLDHVGVGPPVDGDDIYNGAGDNAAGTAVLLEVARVLAELPTAPRRSILFVAVTAEERGLVGSDYFVHNPPVARGDIVANINLDSGVFLYDFADIIPFGTSHSSLDGNVRRVAQRQGLAVGADPLPEEALFTRSDHYRFVQQGIPSMFFMCGMTARDGGIDGLTELRRYVAEHLHRPSDEISLPWNYDAAARYARFVAEVTRDVADADERPTWNQGDVFSRPGSR